MPLIVKAWQRAGKDALPYPVIDDDSASFPESVVRDVRKHLDSLVEKYRAARKPTDQRIDVVREISDGKAALRMGASFVDGDTNLFHQGPIVEFEIGTAEILLIHKATKKALAHYHYLHARTVQAPQLHLLGPLLWVEQTGTV